MSGFNWVDNAILFIFLGSIVAGLMRGLMKEIVSLLSWLAAFIVAVMFSPKLAGEFTSSPQVVAMISSATNAVGVNTTQPVSVLSLGVSFVGIFVGVLVVGSIISSLMSGVVESGGISLTNRLLGSLFGFGRGFIIAVVTIFLVQLSPIKYESYWSRSQIVMAFQPAVQWFGNKVQPGFQSLKSKVGDSLENINPQNLFNNM